MLAYLARMVISSNAKRAHTNPLACVLFPWYLDLGDFTYPTWFQKPLTITLRPRYTIWRNLALHDGILKTPKPQAVETSSCQIGGLPLSASSSRGGKKARAQAGSNLWSEHFSPAAPAAVDLFGKHKRQKFSFNWANLALSLPGPCKIPEAQLYGDRVAKCLSLGGLLKTCNTVQIAGGSI